MSFPPLLKNTGRIFPLFFLFIFLPPAKCQDASHGFNRGSFYFFWGYNRGYFSKSDIHFNGTNYDFTLKDVRSNDRQSKLGVRPYLEIEQMTIPQYNYRLGYCFSDKFNLSLGFDHMKYVVNQGQTVTMNGFIKQSGTSFDGDHVQRRMELTPNFLQFEHTDGLNYIDVELTRTDLLSHPLKHVGFNSMAGFGAGVLCPRTRAMLMDRNLNDEWHISGYGLSSHLGLSLTFYDHFFLQTTVKGGFINLPDIVTSPFSEDKAKQHFFFVQTNVVLGYRWNLRKKSL